MIKLNLGCGACQPAGWINTDSSLNSLLQRMPVIGKVVPKLFKSRVYEVNNAVYMDVTKKWKYADNSVDVVYASHLFEHLSQAGANLFLKESMRVLKPGSPIRLAVPDIYKEAKRYVQDYESNGEYKDTNNPTRQLIWACNLHRENMYPGKLSPFKKMLYEWQGYPHQHKMMYDEKSLTLKLKEHGFVNIVPASYGVSKYISSIKDVEGDREQYMSVYLEAQKPT